MFSKLKVIYYASPPQFVLRKSSLPDSISKCWKYPNVCFLKVPCVAVVENMCYFDADDKRYYPFGRGSGSQVCNLSTKLPCSVFFLFPVWWYKITCYVLSIVSATCRLFSSLGFHIFLIFQLGQLYVLHWKPNVAKFSFTRFSNTIYMIKESIAYGPKVLCNLFIVEDC